MKLYGSLASPYVARVVMFAELKGLELPQERAPGGMGSDEFKQINPTGKIPALLVDGQCIAESTVICEYIETVCPQPELITLQPLNTATTRMIARMTDLYIAPHNSPLSRMRAPEQRDQAVIDQQAALFAAGFAHIGAFMDTGPLAAGPAPSLGDCALAPFIVMLKHTIFPRFEEIPDPTEGEGRLAEWWSALTADDQCGAFLDRYDQELTQFLAFLRKRLEAQG